MPESEAPQPTDEDCSQLLADLAASRATPTQHQVIRNWFVSVRTNSSAGPVEALEAAKAIAEDAPELNHSNYDHDQVCQLDTAMVELHGVLVSALAAHKATPHAG